MPFIMIVAINPLIVWFMLTFIYAMCRLCLMLLMLTVEIKPVILYVIVLGIFHT